MTNFVLCITALATFVVAQVFYFLSHIGFFPTFSYLTLGSEWDFFVYLSFAFFSVLCLVFLASRLWRTYKDPKGKNRPVPKTKFGMMVQQQEDDYDDLFDDLMAMVSANNRQAPTPGRVMPKDDGSFKKLSDLIPSAVSLEDDLPEVIDVTTDSAATKHPRVPDLPKQPEESPAEHTTQALKPSIDIQKPIVAAPAAIAPPPIPADATPSTVEVPAMPHDSAQPVPTAKPIMRPDMSSSTKTAIPFASLAKMAIPKAPAVPEAPKAPVSQIPSVPNANPIEAPSSIDVQNLRKPTSEPVMKEKMPEEPPKKDKPDHGPILSASEMRKTMSGKSGPLEATIAVLEKAGVSSSMYAIDRDQEGAICVHKGRNGMYEIHDFIDGRPQNVYIAKDERDVSRTLAVRLRERLNSEHQA